MTILLHYPSCTIFPKIKALYATAVDVEDEEQKTEVKDGPLAANPWSLSRLHANSRDLRQLLLWLKTIGETLQPYQQLGI